jgi:hypothetical protein
MQFLENFYSYRRTDSAISAALAAESAEQAALAAIENALVFANSEFFARHYQSAIDAYLRAAALIFAQIDPGFSIGRIGELNQTVRDPALFESLLSASVEWFNVLPVKQPLTATSPRVVADPALLAGAAQIDGTGLQSGLLLRANARSTVADWQVAQTYGAQGNASQAQFFLARAQATDPDTFGLLQSGKSPLPPVTGAPAQNPGGFQEVEGGLSGEKRGPQGRAGTTPAAAARSAAAPVGFVGPGGIASSTGSTDGIVVPRTPLPQVLTTQGRSVGFTLQGQTIPIGWNAGEGPATADVTALLYQTRIQVNDLNTLYWIPFHYVDVAAQLPHDYYYVIPLGLAECYHAMGDYARAEQHYLEAAGYQFLNVAVEGAYVWQRLASLYLDWGNSFFRDDDAQSALPIYQNVVMIDATVPNAALYTTPGLSAGAAAARSVIGALAAGTDVTALGVNPVLASFVVGVYQQLLKIKGGLDYWGHRNGLTIPIWTFDFLQATAINFAQLAVSAEKDFIAFQQHADEATLARQQLAQQVEQTKAAQYAAQLEAYAALQEVSAYGAAASLAAQRATDDQNLAQQYRDEAPTEQMDQAVAAIQSGVDPSAVDAQEAASVASSEYQQARLDDQANEMAQAATQATDETNAAAARYSAALAAQTVANLRAQAAQQNLTAFDAQFFTPDVWQRLGDASWQLYQGYLTMALRTARLMQRAYNFETDQSLQLIKADYSTGVANGLLGAELLIADIERFTFDLVTSHAGKPQPLRQTISLSQSYGFGFESQFRRTGILDFDTRIDDFDGKYPGIYAGRIETVEVDVEGLVPIEGISGTLSNTGVSGYRVPAALWIDRNTSGLKYRVQPAETLVFSDFRPRDDSLLFTTDERMRRIFQGAGVVSSWRLELPPSVNDIDYNAITDVRLTFYYKARYDPDLHDAVLAQLRGRTGVNARQRGMPLRWVYPDAFFHFQNTSVLTIELRPTDFPFTEIQPMLTAIDVLVATDGTVAPGGLTVGLTTPTQADIDAQTDASGIIRSSTPGSPWAPLGTGSALGTFTIAMIAANNPQLIRNGVFTLEPIVNISLVMAYTFTPRG